MLFALLNVVIFEFDTVTNSGVHNDLQEGGGAKTIRGWIKGGKAGISNFNFKGVWTSPFNLIEFIDKIRFFKSTQIN